MLHLLRKLSSNNVTVEEVTNNVIEEIHETFYTEVDRLLAEANISHSLDTDKKDLIDKCERLKALGFTNTKEVKEAESEIDRLNKLKSDNEAKQTLIEAINYFTVKYPNYKFITEESVKKICAKYNLIYGEIDGYIGTVPDKNLKHIEDFKIGEEDECFVHEVFFMSSFSGKESSILKQHMDLESFKIRTKPRTNSPDRWEYNIVNTRMDREVRKKCPLEIAAPQKDFDLTGKEVSGFKISKVSLPDPIVLKPVIFKGQKHYLIVTMWADENLTTPFADSVLFNEKQN